MKYLFIILVAITGLTSCEDVIDVDLTSEDPRLIIDAMVRVNASEPFTKVVVKVRETSGFFDPIPAVSPDRITLTNLSISGGTTDPPELVEEEPGSGIFSREFDTNYLTEGILILQVFYEGDVYTATTSFVPSVPLDSLVQGDGFLFDEDDIEVILKFTDDGSRNDFYLFDFSFGNYLVSEDEFYQGQQFEFSYFYDDEVVPGDEVTISIMGVDEEFFRYMDKLIDQSGEDFGPFETPALTVRGNIVNSTGSVEDFALGYFAVVQEYADSLVIE